MKTDRKRGGEREKGDRMGLIIDCNRVFIYKGCRKLYGIIDGSFFFFF